MGGGGKIGSLSGIFGFVKILKAIEYIPKPRKKLLEKCTVLSTERNRSLNVDRAVDFFGQ